MYFDEFECHGCYAECPFPGQGICQREEECRQENERLWRQVEKEEEERTLKDLHACIRKNMGFIVSENTVKKDALMCSFYDVLANFNLDKELRLRIENLFIGNPGSINFNWGNCKMRKDPQVVYSIGGSIEEKAVHLLEETFDYFNEISPEGFYFGPSYNDGTCWGWFYDKENWYK